MTATPPTDQQLDLDEIEARIAAYQQHPDLGFACCSAHPAADTAAALVAEVRRLRAQVAATHTKSLATEADEIVTHCPDHGPQDQDGVWMDCHCAVADDIRRRLALPAEELHVVADDSDDPEHIDDCPGCEAFTLTGHTARPPAAETGAADAAR